MADLDPQVEAYITRSADFARPILVHLRKLIHKACPAVQESIKWGHPNFEYAGGILCNLAAFKQHCAFGFWKASLMKDPHGVLHVEDKKAAGHFDRLTSVKDLPADRIMLAYIKEAALLNEQGIKKAVPVKKAAAKEWTVPEALTLALKKNKKAQAAFDAFSPSHRREYSEWITAAKTEETRQKRIATTLEWLTEGKSRNWKYQKK